MAILLKWWIMPIGKFALERVWACILRSTLVFWIGGLRSLSSEFFSSNFQINFLACFNQHWFLVIFHLLWHFCDIFFFSFTFNILWHSFLCNMLCFVIYLFWDFPFFLEIRYCVTFFLLWHFPFCDIPCFVTFHLFWQFIFLIFFLHFIFCYITFL